MHFKKRKGIKGMKYLLGFLLILYPVFGNSQTAKPLSEILWNRVNKCYSMFEDMDDDGIPDFYKIDDSKNGYLKIWGGWPTCGCSCTSIIGAYKNSSGEFDILQFDEVICSWEKKISSNKALIEILPDGFGINSFILKELQEYTDNPIFFVSIEIPHLSTDTKIKLELIPFGLRPEGKGLLCYEYKELEGFSNCKSLLNIEDIAKNCQDNKTLDYIMNGEFEKISQIDNAVVFKEIGNDYSSFKSKEELQYSLIELHQIYKSYQLLEATEIMLGWDRQTSRFFIKEKSGKPENLSFKEFLINNEYWSPMC
jgi:hypothetical protein